MRRNIDAWWPMVQSRRGRGDRHERLGLRRDGQGIRPLARATIPPTPTKASRIADLTRDLSELLPDLVGARPPGARRGAGSGAAAPQGASTLAFHPPCTLQHGQRLRGGVETALSALGFDVARRDERGAPVLRLGRHVLGAAARARQRAARPQARATSTSSRRRRSCRPTSAASSTCRAARRRRCGTGSRCSTTRSRADARAPR